MEIEKELQKFDMPGTVIEKMAEQYLPLKIKDMTDKEGYIAVREARLIVKGARVSVRKRHKELKKDPLLLCQALDAEANRLTGLLEPIEAHLEAQEDWWDAEKERIKQDAIRAEQEKLQARVDALRQYNCSIPVVALQVMDDTEFEWTLESVKLEFEVAETARVAAEKAEVERLEAIRVEQEAERLRLEEVARVQAEKDAAVKAEQEAERLRLEVIAKAQAEKELAIKQEQDRLAAEKKAIEDAENERVAAVERERVRLAEIEQAKVTATEQERIRAEHEAEMELLEAERQKALLPDKEKLRCWLQEITYVTEMMPILKDKDMRVIAQSTKEGLVGVVDYLQVRLT